LTLFKRFKVTISIIYVIMFN